MSLVNLRECSNDSANPMITVSGVLISCDTFVKKRILDWLRFSMFLACIFSYFSDSASRIRLR